MGKLFDMKESQLIQIDEYAIAMGMKYDPGFSQWVPHKLKECDVIMALDKKSSVTYLKNTNKFGSECPKTVENTLTLDKQESNTMLADVLPNE